MYVKRMSLPRATSRVRLISPMTRSPHWPISSRMTNLSSSTASTPPTAPLKRPRVSKLWALTMSRGSKEASSPGRSKASQFSPAPRTRHRPFSRLQSDVRINRNPQADTHPHSMRLQKKINARPGLPAAGVAAWFLLLPLSPLVWAAQAFQESGGKVVIETENYDNNIARNGKAWVLETRISGYSGTGHMTALPDGLVVQKTGYTTSSPELVYNVQFTTTGIYYIWARGAGGGNDSYHAGIATTPPAAAAGVGE